MRLKTLFLTSLLLAMSVIAFAEGPRKDYSDIRGVCHTGWRADTETIKKELGYAKKINLNSTRIWLGKAQYDRNPQQFLNSLKQYVRTCHEMGFTVMPIIWNGNGLNPDVLSEDVRKENDKYVKDVVNTLKDEPGLLMWDVMNEPTCNDYHNHAPSPEVQLERRKEIFAFVRHNIEYIKSLDKKNAVTVGVTYPKYLEDASADLVDVLCFHDYLETESRIDASYQLADSLSKVYNKPIINSELGCIGRSNPYDLALRKASEYKAGYYLFELMIGGYWGDIHGIFYKDGTIRDPSIVAAIMGCFRNRDLTTSIKENPNKEGYVTRALKQLEAAMSDEAEVFKYKKASSDEILEAAEMCANILEASQMVPMYELPTAKIQYWKNQKPNERDEIAIRQYAYELAKTLKEYCQIIY